MMEQWEWSAQHLLYVFRTFFNNFRPLSDSSEESAADIAGLSPAQIDYLRYLIESKGLPPRSYPSFPKATTKIYACFPGQPLTSHVEAILACRRSVTDVADSNYEMVWGAKLFETM